MKERYSTLSGWMIPLAKAMELYNIDVSEALDSCGITLASIKNQESWVSAEKLARILDYSTEKTGRSDFPIIVAEQFHPGIFHALGYAMMSSDCLQDAFARIKQYKRVVSNACQLHLDKTDKHLVFGMSVYTFETSGKPVMSDALVLTFVATLVQFSRKLAGNEISPKLVRLSIALPDNCQQINNFFNCPVEYGCDRSSLMFDLDEASAKLFSSNPIIAQAHEKILDDFLTRLDKNDLVQAVKNKVYQQLPLGAPSQTEIAKILCMSLRNLQRKLKEQNTSYKEILENSRQKLTMEYMEQSHLSLTEISYLVGFSSVGNFNRAFKRWTNKTPGEYRNHCLNQTSKII